MTDKMLEFRLRKLEAIEAQIKEMEKAAEAVRDELKADLESKGLEEVKTANGCVVRWRTVNSDRFDVKSFHEAHPDLYTEFTKLSKSTRFSYFTA